ncbi:MAG TPA: lysophospholipid acyltransferase family protein [Candidatus Dormibacteraeota bacterium]|nr:lysophospholipid acyltransferase family protein [Candidatus Dormibacteraeota bacterium]
MSYSFLTGLARLLTRLLLGSKFHLRGTSNVPNSGPLLMVSNHVGGVDPAIIGAWTPRPVWFMAKAELFRGRFAWLMRGYHAFPVMRHSPDRTALRRAFDLLKQGSAVVLFPEGHRSENARLLRAEPGAGFVARRSGAPLVPIAITGTQNVLGRHSMIPRRAEVEMTFGEPFQLPERNRDGSPMDHQQSADFLMTKIAALLPLEYQGEYTSSPMPKSAQA